ncbi:MAG: DUF983 domain-containing protein [Bacteroidia bacterium]|nr:DUF983 domain-containing protein [Bacteroidia bacterium]MDW8333854.1 DUF983 domain-containing protein [Bacteroidia bacterium]
MFKYGAYQKISKHLEMHPQCSHCGFNFEPETGFYWGAMYISYMFVSAIFIAYVIVYFIFKPRGALGYAFIGGSYLLTVLALWPALNRYARAAMLYFSSSSAKFDPRYWS